MSSQRGDRTLGVRRESRPRWLDEVYRGAYRVHVPRLIGRETIRHACPEPLGTEALCQTLNAQPRLR
jgi:hypothetical protein